MLNEIRFCPQQNERYFVCDRSRCHVIKTRKWLPIACEAVTLIDVKSATTTQWHVAATVHLGEGTGMFSRSLWNCHHCHRVIVILKRQTWHKQASCVGVTRSLSRLLHIYELQGFVRPCACVATCNSSKYTTGNDTDCIICVADSLLEC